MPSIRPSMRPSEENPFAAGSSFRVGVVSDTHGLVRPELIACLRGVDLILHAGDVGKRDVLETLSTVAPVHAVRGNVDRDVWAEDLPPSRVVEIGGLRFFILHNIHLGSADPEREGFDVVVSGHSHSPSITRRGRVLYVNPGSAGPRRFHLPVSMARIVVRDRVPEAELIPLLEDVP